MPLTTSISSAILSYETRLMSIGVLTVLALRGQEGQRHIIPNTNIGRKFSSFAIIQLPTKGCAKPIVS